MRLAHSVSQQDQEPALLQRCQLLPMGDAGTCSEGTQLNHSQMAALTPNNRVSDSSVVAVP